ncbi:MAG TPA: alpha/beta fold hydrolase [Steroidobacteraceae bacterium]|jgi:pimeloyl-ACP methyl ester carboxylesterase
MHRLFPGAAATIACVAAAAVAVAATAADPATPAQQPASASRAAAIITQEFMLPSADPGLRLYVRNKHPAALHAYRAQRTLLFVHGATYPADSSFDLRLNGLSWMDYIASHGYDVYLVDLRGYGRSTHPAAMDEPPERHAPLEDTAAAVTDVGTAVDFILRRRHLQKLDLMGWSWGTSIMGAYTAQHNDKVEKLVLYAPIWTRTAGRLLTDTGAPLGAYRTVSVAAARARWLHGVPADKQADLIPPGWFEAWARATFPPAGNGASGRGLLRAPNGVFADFRTYWNAGKPMYDPADIRVPTFLAHGEWDADAPNDMLYAVFARLTHAPYKRYVQIGEGTHTVMMEKNRMQLFESVQQFLDESLHPGE